MCINSELSVRNRPVAEWTVKSTANNYREEEASLQLFAYTVCVAVCSWKIDNRLHIFTIIY